MSDENRVQFNEPNYNTQFQYNKRKDLADYIVDKGWVKNRQQAMYALFGVIGISILVVFFMFRSNTDITDKNIFNPETAEPDINNMHSNK